MNPETHHLPLFATRRDSRIVLDIYARHPTISQTFGSSEGRQVEFLRMLNTADDSATFCPFDPDGFAYALASRWLPLLKGGQAYRPLFEAKLIDQYNHRAATFVGTDPAKRYGLHAAATQSTDAQLADPEYVSVPRYWVLESDLPQQLQRPVLLVYRDAVSAVADARCLSATFVPWGGVGDTLKLAYCSGGAADDLIILASTFNSFVLDYVFRQKSSSSHASAFILRQLPLPALHVFSAECPWARETSLQSWLTVRQLELNYTAHDLSPLARALGWTGRPFPWSTKRRAEIRAELDAAFFILYGLARDDVSHVLEAFPIVRRRDEEEFGEYVTKRRILEVFDSLNDCTRQARRYETRLDPPPADARLTAVTDPRSSAAPGDGDAARIEETP